jgi:putative redox protein
MTLLSSSASLVNDKLQFTGTAGAHPPVVIDYIPPLGDGEGYMSLQLLLMSLASCAGSAVLTLLRRMGRTISGFTVHAAGERREQHPTSFSSITLEFLVHSPDVLEADVQKAIAMSESTLCPVWDMLKGNVEIGTTVRILAAPAAH